MIDLTAMTFSGVYMLYWAVTSSKSYLWYVAVTEQVQSPPLCRIRTFD